MKRIDVEALKEKFGVLEVWNKVIVNTTPHPIKILIQGEIIEVPPAKSPFREEDEDSEILFVVPAVVAQPNELLLDINFELCYIGSVS
jgi:hypothetical protein